MNLLAARAHRAEQIRIARLPSQVAGGKARLGTKNKFLYGRGSYENKLAIHSLLTYHGPSGFGNLVSTLNNHYRFLYANDVTRALGFLREEELIIRIPTWDRKRNVNRFYTYKAIAPWGATKLILPAEELSSKLLLFLSKLPTISLT